MYGLQYNWVFTWIATGDLVLLLVPDLCDDLPTSACPWRYSLTIREEGEW